MVLIQLNNLLLIALLPRMLGLAALLVPPQLFLIMRCYRNRSGELCLIMAVTRTS